jgi:hypothetical protein
MPSGQKRLEMLGFLTCETIYTNSILTGSQAVHSSNINHLEEIKESGLELPVINQIEVGT